MAPPKALHDVMTTEGFREGQTKGSLRTQWSSPEGIWTDYRCPQVTRDWTEVC